MNNKIIKSKVFLDGLRIIEEREMDRIYCKHGMEHLLDVARIAMLINVERNLSISKELIYSTALLHDIGRSKEYTDGTPHEKAGVMLSEEILNECEADKEFTECVLYAIESHRGLDSLEYTNTVKDNLRALIKEADHLSRNCFMCKAKDTCKWSEEKKNKCIKY